MTQQQQQQPPCPCVPGPVATTPFFDCCPPVPVPSPTFSQVVLSYTVTAVNVTPAQMKVAMETVPLDTTDYPVAVNLTSDTTIQTPTGAQRTLIFALEPSFNMALLIGADPAAFFQNFYTLTLSQALVAPVVQLPPIVT
jgi:hypothetical protein